LLWWWCSGAFRGFVVEEGKQIGVNGLGDHGRCDWMRPTYWSQWSSIIVASGPIEFQFTRKP
jgi:hypothetical protein